MEKNKIQNYISLKLGLNDLVSFNIEKKLKYASIDRWLHNYDKLSCYDNGNRWHRLLYCSVAA